VNLFFIAALVLLIIIGFIAMSVDSHVTTEMADLTDVQGKFTLLLYGSGSANDFVNIAILDKEGDPYSFEIYAPDFSYTVQAGLDAAQALQEAERFVRRNIQSERSRLQRILGPAGAGIGFELRPLYPVATFGRDDIIDVRYSIKDRKIVVRVALDPAMQRQSTN